MKINPFTFIALVLMIGATLVATTEPKINKAKKEKILVQEKINKKILKIMTSGECQGSRAENIEYLVNSGKQITRKSVGIVFGEWLKSVQRRDGDFLLIHFTPDMLSEEHKDKFKRTIIGINREEVIDKLNALNVVIDHSPEKITGAFGGLINPRFGMYTKSDMSIYWLEYFLSKKNVDVNNWKKHTPMEGAIYAINYKVAKLLIQHGYKPNNKDFEFIQEEIAEVKEDDIGQYHQESTIEAIHKIETLLVGHLK